MADLTNRATLTYDESMRATCPACFQRIVWQPIPGSPRDFRAVHAQCGLTFAVMVSTYVAFVMDDSGEELDANLDPIVNHGDQKQEPQKESVGQLLPDGTVLIRGTNDPR